MKQGFDVSGTVGNISIYKVRGSDEPIVRTKGGPTKRMVKTRKSFATTRKNNSEFGGRARMTKQVMEVLRVMKYLGDYNIAGPLNSLFIPIQSLDTVNAHGQRNIALTKNPGLLTGFNLNRRTPFTTIVTNSPEYSLLKETLTATITIPGLLPEINFFPQNTYSWYRFIAVFGLIEDLFYNPNGYQTITGNQQVNGYSVVNETDWLPVTPESPALQLTCGFKGSARSILQRIGRNNYSCLLGIGISFGAMTRGRIEAVKYVGGGKVLAMG